MNSRGFAILLVVAVAASIACGLIVERHTAPGLERTVWFAIGLAAIIFPAGWYAERRGWVHGVWYGSAAARAAAEAAGKTSAAGAQAATGPMTGAAASASASASATASATATATGTITESTRTDAQTTGGLSVSATRPLSGESK